MEAHFTRRGFLPAEDPLTHFEPGSELASLDTLGRDLPSLLQDKGFRRYARGLRIPALPPGEVPLPVLRLDYVRLGFLASAYINQVGEEPAKVLPANIALPLRDVCARLGRPPILSYDGYALSNWKRFDPAGPIALGNLDTIQNFVHLYDEHWFILVHVAIEALAARIFAAIGQIDEILWNGQRSEIAGAMAEIVQTIWAQVEVLRRIPEKMDPALYYRTFRPYIRFFEGVVYEGVDAAPMDFRGETGAQSSIVPLLEAFLGIPHEQTMLTEHLDEMQRFMPAEHRALLLRIHGSGYHAWIKDDRGLFNEALEALATFREVHLGYAKEYIARRVSDPRGTGGTPYLEWLGQLIVETRAHKIA